jgi:carbamoyltransferase
MKILGIGGIQSDPAVALVKDAQLAAAVEEKKVARRTEQGALPRQAILSALDLGNVSPAEIDCVAVARPIGDARETDVHLELRAAFPNARLLVVDHHMAHAASAFYCSPFEDATVLTLDRAGDFRCGARWHASGRDIQLDKELYYPDSLGDLYGRVTELLGYRPNADEHKVQWLSSLGDDRFVSLFEAMLPSGADAWPRVDRTVFDRNRTGHGGFSGSVYKILGVRVGETVSDRLARDIAAGIQGAVERIVLKMAHGSKRVCLAGGLGLNAMLVSALEREHQVFVQPAAGNAGTSIGAALYAWHQTFQRSERIPLRDLFLGPSYSPEQIKQVLENCKLQFRFLQTTDEVISAAIEELNEHRILAWMQGRMEFGPRALGNRSILASPRDPYSTENLNAFIKHREPFRKFAASVTAESASKYFEVGDNARFLASLGRVREAHHKTFESAILGKDCVRVHVVDKADNPLFHRLLKEAGKTTGLPVLYNTSFNLFNDPLVCSPRDAARGFFSSGIDAMIAGNFLLRK